MLKYRKHAKGYSKNLKRKRRTLTDLIKHTRISKFYRPNLPRHEMKCSRTMLKSLRPIVRSESKIGVILSTKKVKKLKNKRSLMKRE